jgi:hypothetical protein
VEGERHLRPVPGPVHDLRAQSQARVTGQGLRRRPRGSGRPGTIAGWLVAGPPRARAPGQPGAGGGHPGEQQEFTTLDRHSTAVPTIGQ